MHLSPPHFAFCPELLDGKAEEATHPLLLEKLVEVFRPGHAGARKFSFGKRKIKGKDRRVAPALERGDDAGAHERRLARARWAHEGEERLFGEARHDLFDHRLAAEEARRVRLLERGEAGEWALALAPIDRLLAGQDLIKRGDVSANVEMKPGDVLIIPRSWF